MTIFKPARTVTVTPDLVLLVSVLAILGFGLVMIYDASSVAATRDFGDSFYFVKEQIKWAILGLASLFLAARIPYHFYKKIALPAFVVSLILLILVFIPGIGVEAYGAKRWIDLGFTIVQPAEFAKIALAIFLAAWFSGKKNVSDLKTGLLPVAVILATLGGLLLFQPDLGSFVVIAAIVLIVYFAAGANLLYYLAGIPVLIGSVLAVILSSDYRRARLETFLNPTLDPQGQGYHINQVLLALGSGGLFGAGVGQSRGKYEYIPEVTTDSIFAVIGEELGFIGAMILIFAFGVIIYRAFTIARNAQDAFGKLLALGIAVAIGAQVILNLSAMVALAPLTGVPLPLISYGGSSLVVTLFSIGVLLNISKSSKN